jgi:hypothetical protein
MSLPSLIHVSVWVWVWLCVCVCVRRVCVCVCVCVCVWVAWGILDPPKLCNGTRLCVKMLMLMTNIIEATILTGSAKGEDVFIPRIPLIPSDTPFDFKRLQCTVRLSFAMTINKAQGAVAFCSWRQPRKFLLLSWSTIRCLLSSWNPKTSLHLRSGRTNHEHCVPIRS